MNIPQHTALRRYLAFAVAVIVAGVVAVVFFPRSAVVSSNAVASPTDDWITVNKDYSSERYVDLDQITPANVSGLKEVCEIQLNEPSWFSSGLLKVGRTLYAATWRSVYAVDATTCELRWAHAIDVKQIGNVASRGLAYFDGTIFAGTVDGRMIALEAQTGKVLWDQPNPDPSLNESYVAAPIAWNGKVFEGNAVGDIGVRGRLFALDAKTGKQLWNFSPIPVGDEPFAKTWGEPPPVKPAGGAFWTSFSLDPTTGEFFGPVANPSPDYTLQRMGANLYTNSVVSLNAATGHLNWYHQAVRADTHDWDLGTAPALYRTHGGRAMLAIAGKDGHVYGLDRATKTVVFDTPATTLKNTGPVGETPQLVCPGSVGGAQWNGTAYDPGTGDLYVGMVDRCFFYARIDPKTHQYGRVVADFSVKPTGWITAIDGESGHVAWKYHAEAPVIAGLVPTKSGLLFAGDVHGNLLAFDARSGSVLHRIDAKGTLNNGLIGYAVDGSEYVAVAAGGVTLNAASVSGPLHISVFGLHGGDTPKVVSLPREPWPTVPKVPPSFAAYAFVCGTCHGASGNGGFGPPLARQTKLGDPAALKAFLASVPQPMPRLYPGLLDDQDVALIADAMKKIIKGEPQLPDSVQPLPVAPFAPAASASPMGALSMNTLMRDVSGASLTHATAMASGSPQWRSVYSVLTSPRCINCHTMTDFPRQGDDRHPHYYGVLRGADDQGAAFARCATCHGSANNPITGIPGRTGWKLAPLKMAWERAPGVAMTSPQLCAMIKDRNRNGDRDISALLRHLDTDLVLWAWDPGTRPNGEMRQKPPVSHEAFVAAFKRWGASGAQCSPQQTNGTYSRRKPDSTARDRRSHAA